MKIPLHDHIKQGGLAVDRRIDWLVSDPIHLSNEFLVAGIGVEEAQELKAPLVMALHHAEVLFQDCALHVDHRELPARAQVVIHGDVAEVHPLAHFPTAPESIDHAMLSPAPARIVHRLVGEEIRVRVEILEKLLLGQHELALIHNRDVPPDVSLRAVGKFLPGANGIPVHPEPLLEAHAIGGIERDAIPRGRLQDGLGNLAASWGEFPHDHRLRGLPIQAQIGELLLDTRHELLEAFFQKSIHHRIPQRRARGVAPHVRPRRAVGAKNGIVARVRVLDVAEIPAQAIRTGRLTSPACAIHDPETGHAGGR